MILKSKVTENILQLNIAAQAVIDCTDPDFEIEIEKFDFSTEFTNDEFVEKCQLIFVLTNEYDDERIVLALDYTDRYRSLRSMLASRDSSKSNDLEVISIDSNFESRKRYLQTIVDEETYVDIVTEIIN